MCTTPAAALMPRSAKEFFYLPLPSQSVRFSLTSKLVAMNVAVLSLDGRISELLCMKCGRFLAASASVPRLITAGRCHSCSGRVAAVLERHGKSQPANEIRERRRKQA
jgi:hypothetical protein